MHSFGVQKLSSLPYPYPEKEHYEKGRKCGVNSVEKTEEEQAPYRG